jgi:hypothetical protein
VKGDAREFVFFGADHAEEEVEFRTEIQGGANSSAGACRASRRSQASPSSRVERRPLTKTRARHSDCSSLAGTVLRTSSG